MQGADQSGSSQMDVMDAEQLQAFLDDASNPRLVGRRQVKGIECEVVAFDISPEEMRDLAALSGRSSLGTGPDQDVQVGDFHGEVAIGVEDGLMRQMLIDMDMADRNNPAEKAAFRLTMTMWDINSPDVTIEAPEGVKPGAGMPFFPIPTAAPTRQAA